MIMKQVSFLFLKDHLSQLNKNKAMKTDNNKLERKTNCSAENIANEI